MTKKEALKLVGSIGEPSKMPGKSWGISAKRCKAGSKIAEVENSVCSGCYALRWRYLWKPIQNALDVRLEKFDEDPQGWMRAMVHLIDGESYFRWFDSGDLQSLWMLRCIVNVVEQTPNTKHWLPTKEYKIVSAYCAKYEVPKNLVIRLSGYLVDGKTPDALARRIGVQVSGVMDLSEDDYAPMAWTCPSRHNHSQCGECRVCWDGDTYKVVYPKH